jgi:glycosyltransferase involved in cell wall biosynthesis
MKFEHKPLKIAFLTARDPKDRRTWSGTYYYMGQALQKHCGEVYYLGPVRTLSEIAVKCFNKATRLLVKKNYAYMQSLFLAKHYAGLFQRKLSGLSPDLIFAPAAAAETAFLSTRIPIVHASDATFALACNYYPDFSNLLKISIREGNAVEEKAMQKASLILLPSQWAAQSAINDYHIDKDKIHIVPFGANLEKIPSKEIILKKKKSDRCRLLFLGVSWQRKGGDIAFETLLKLEELGIHAELIVCGCTPPRGFSHKMMSVIPFLDKNNETQREELARLLLASDFLLLPTRSEAYGIVFCEANAFGLPVITTNTGGVSGVVKDGENGFMLPPSARGAEYAKIIQKIYQNDQHYYELTRSSRAAFDDRLNWDTWAISVRKLIAKMI